MKEGSFLLQIARPSTFSMNRRISLPHLRSVMSTHSFSRLQGSTGQVSQGWQLKPERPAMSLDASVECATDLFNVFAGQHTTTNFTGYDVNREL